MFIDRPNQSLCRNRGARRRRRIASSRRGAAAIEFALVSFFFLVPMLGMIEVGRMIMVQEILINAAREGARTAIAPNKTDANVRTTIDNYLAASNITGFSRTISPSLGSNPPADTAITVTVSVPCSSVSWGGAPTIFAGRTLTAKVVMMKQK